MELILLPGDSGASLASMYERAFKRAVRLFVVNAYLTEWNTSLVLNPGCEALLIIVGKDFGITRKAACQAVLKWLPAKRKADFMVADQIGGFHPKVVIWEEASGESFILAGSSNLTKAAFETNYEANVCAKLSEADYSKAREWIAAIADASLPLTPDWLEQYDEAQLGGRGKGGAPAGGREPIFVFDLPLTASTDALVQERRRQLKKHEKYREGLIKAFRQCAGKAIDSSQFFDRLHELWNHDNGNRLQGAGFERKGKSADFTKLSQSFIRILDAQPLDRDDVVAREIDRLHADKNSARGAFLSEMLCLQFPKSYPILNNPIGAFLKDVEFRVSRGASEGAYYLDLARKLRASLRQNPDHPAKNLAELDRVIQHEYS
jgi:hypothetical protein